jgi:hypothetical protein
MTTRNSTSCRPGIKATGDVLSEKGFRKRGHTMADVFSGVWKISTRRRE